MAWNISRKERNSEAASPEVDFALVLSRMIDSVNADPKLLRTSVYELARHKLHEQIANEVPDEVSRLDEGGVGRTARGVVEGRRRTLERRPV